jgi:hypothetical protein
MPWPGGHDKPVPKLIVRVHPDPETLAAPAGLTARARPGGQARQMRAANLRSNIFGCIEERQRLIATGGALKWWLVTIALRLPWVGSRFLRRPRRGRGSTFYIRHHAL